MKKKYKNPCICLSLGVKKKGGSQNQSGMTKFFNVINLMCTEVLLTCVIHHLKALVEEI